MSHSRVLALFLMTAAFLSAPLWAGNWEVGPTVGQRFGGRFVETETGTVHDVNAAPAYGFFVGRNFDYGNREAEFLYSRQESDMDLNGFNGMDEVNLSIEQYYFGLTQLFGEDKFRPFLEGLIGFTHFNFSDAFKAQTLFSLGAAGGFRYYATKHIGLRLDGRVYATFSGGNTAVACNGGCAMSYSGSAFWQGEITPSIFVQF